MGEPDSKDSPPASGGLLHRLRSRYGRGGLALLLLVALVGLFCLRHVWHERHDLQKIADIGDRAFRYAKGELPAPDAHLLPKHYGLAGVWAGCVFGAAASAALLALAPLWLPGGPVRSRRAPHTPAAPGGLAFLCLIVSVAASVWIRAPRLEHSFWNDEEYSFRRYTHGEWVMAADGRWQFKAVSPEAGLFDSRNGNNHLLHTLLARESLGIWRFVRSQPREAFSETAERMPAFVAGALTLVLVFALGVELGSGWFGACAAALLAFHPWHVRYAVEARGYSLMLFFLCLALLGLVRAFRDNKTSSWLCFAIGEAGCLLSFVGSVYAIAGINLIALAELCFRREWRRLGPLAGFNLLAAIPVVIWTLPSVPQIIAVFASDPSTLRLGVGWEWLRDFSTHLIAGLHYDLPEPAVHLGTTWLAQSQTSAPAVWLLRTAGLLAIGGLAAAAARSSASRLIILGPFAGGAIAFAEHALKEGPLLIWYLIFMLVPFVLAPALALAWVLRAREAVIAPVLVVLVALFAAATSDQRGRMVRHDRQPIRQAVAAIRDERPEATTAVFGVSNNQTKSYDPRVRVLSSEADLDGVIADAASEGRPLYVYFCGRTVSGQRHPDIMKRVLDETVFEKVSDVPGLEAIFSYEIWKKKNMAKGAAPGDGEQAPQPEAVPASRTTG